MLMPRKPTVIYYLTAVAGGCFLLAACYFPYFLASGAHPTAPAREFVLVYFFTMLVGCVPQILSAFLLRRITARFKWERLWQWILTGTAISWGIFISMAQLGNVVMEWRSGPGWLRMGLMFILVGAVFFAKNPLWLPVPAAAATSGLLFLVQRRFFQKSAVPTAGAASRG